LFYGGDVAAWIKFGNTLKIKLGITIADVNPTLAKSTIESAVDGAFESSADDALMPYLSARPNQNPLYEEIVATGRKDYVVANTIVDKMNSLDDPRRQFYFTLHTNGEYVGGVYGHSNAYGNFSHINDAILAPDFHGFIMTYTELLFYLAEAAERGFDVPLTAEEYYNMGITNSIIEWGGTQADADATWLRQMWPMQRHRMLRPTDGGKRLERNPGSRTTPKGWKHGPRGGDWIILYSMCLNSGRR
jgi:hypothetical protein